MSQSHGVASALRVNDLPVEAVGSENPLLVCNYLIRGRINHREAELIHVVCYAFLAAFCVFERTPSI